MIKTAQDPPGFPWRYDRSEIVADGCVHALGCALGLVGVALLIHQTVATNASATDIVSVCIYAGGLLVMLGCSAAYNLWPVSHTKWLLRRADHAAIYLLIAGTYTPFLPYLRTSSVSLLLFCGVWLTALVGIALKLFLPGRFDRISIGLYLVLSWSGAGAFAPIASAVPGSCLWLLLAGGVVYSVGVGFHVWERLRFQNAIWHSFVLIGAGLHYLAVSEVIGAGTL